MILTVGARDLKNRLGRYLQLARDGARIIVTDRGRPVAELHALAPDSSDVEMRIQQLAADGLVTPPSRHDVPSPVRVRMAKPGGSLAEAVIDGRSDRL